MQIKNELVSMENEVYLYGSLFFLDFYQLPLTENHLHKSYKYTPNLIYLFELV